MEELLHLLQDARTEWDAGRPTRTQTERIVTFFGGRTAFGATNAHGRDSGAFSANGAVECVHDVPRTDAFIQAVMRASQDLETEQGRSFNVIDAGSGPLGILGLTAAFASKYAQVTCLELEPESVKSLHEVIGKFHLEDRVHVVEADARTWIPPNSVDLLVSETMMGPLIDKEYMPAILHNLGKHVTQNGKIIPHALTIDGTLEDPLREGQTTYKKGQSFNFTDASQAPPTHVDAVFDFSDTYTTPGRPVTLKIGSTVKLYRNNTARILLRPHDKASVNQPVPVKEIYGTGGPVGTIRVRYPIGARWDSWEDRILGAEIEHLPTTTSRLPL